MPVGGSDPLHRSPRIPALITFYYSLAPNPMKVALFLEEAELPYALKPVDTRKGEQHGPELLSVNPNAKVPVIVDQDTGATVFDSNAILLYLAEKTGRFLPENTPAARGERGRHRRRGQAGGSSALNASFERARQSRG